MADAAEVTGVVVGEPGTPVAGWVQLGERGTRRPVGSGTLRVRTDDDREVELSGVAQARIAPVRRRTAEWQEHERDELARACIEDAPAPDVEVELLSAVVRAGERVAAWGVVGEHAFVETSTGDGAFRSSAQAVVARVEVSHLAVGEDAIATLRELRAPAPAPAPAKPVLATPSVPRVARPVAPKRIDDGTVDRLGRGLVFWLPVALVLVLGTLALAVTRGDLLAFSLAGAMCGVPLAIDAGLMPPYRPIPQAPVRSLAVPVVTYLIVVGLAVMLGYAVFDLGRSKNVANYERIPTARMLGIVAGTLSLVPAGWCVLATRPRRRITARIAAAAPLPMPVPDGQWGSIDGVVAPVGSGAMRAVGGVTVVAADVKIVRGVGSANSKGHWTSSEESRVQNVVPEISITRAGHTVRAHTMGGLWWSAIVLAKISEDRRQHENGEILLDGAQVRLVGRAKEGVFVRGGAESLLVFAVGREGDVAAALRHVRRRDLAGVGLVGVGVLLALAGFVRSAVG